MPTAWLRAPHRLALFSAVFTLVSGTAAFAQDDRPKPDSTPTPVEPTRPDDTPKPPDDTPKPKPDEATPPPDDAAARKAADDTKRAKAAQDAAKPQTAEAEKKSDRPIHDALRLVLGPFKLSPIILVQAQAIPYVGADSFSLSGDPADSAGFRLQRARFGFDVNLMDQGEGRVSVELGSREDGTARIHDAWLAYIGFPYAQVFAGAVTVPFSRYELANSADTGLIERPLAVRSMAPGQQVGVLGHGAVGKNAFIYDVGVFNGYSRSDQFYAGYAQNYAPFGNRFNGIAVVTRLATEPVGPLGPTIMDEIHQSPRFGIGADYTFSNSGARVIHAASADALLHARGFHLLAEFLYTAAIPKERPAQPSTTTTNVKSFGLVAETGYMIVPKLFGVSARFEYIDPNTDVKDEGDNWLVGGGPMVEFLEDIVKIQAEYTHREEVHGQSLSNDAVVLQGQLAL